MTNTVGAIVGLQTHIQKANERTKNTPEADTPSETECSCSAARALFFGGCKCETSKEGT